MTSQRIPTFARVAVFTTNPGDEDHWTVTRMKPGSNTWPYFGYHPDHSSITILPDGAKVDARRMWFRIPKGDNPHIPQGVREESFQALSDDPDQQARLCNGEFGAIRLGAQVAEGYDVARHVAKERVTPVSNEPLFLGWDCWHTPVCVIGQEYKGQVRFLASLYVPGRSAGIRELCTDYVKPWLAKNAPWAFKSFTMMQHGIDPSGETGDQSDPDQNCFVVVEEILGANIQPGPTKWDARIGPLLAIFKKHNGLVIDPIDCEPLIKSYAGRWFYPIDRAGNVKRDLPKKPNHPWEDLGDASLYCLNRISPSAFKFTEPARVVTGFDARLFQQPVIQTGFDPRMMR